MLRILFALGILVLAACRQAGPPTAGIATEFNAVCSEANMGQRVAVDGYLRLPDSFTGDQSVMLNLYETDSFTGQPIGVQMPIGSEANQMEQVPLSYSDDDLRVYLADGQVTRYGTKVKLSGTVYNPPPSIEALVEHEFECALENPLVELAN